MASVDKSRGSKRRKRPPLDCKYCCATNIPNSSFYARHGLGRCSLIPPVPEVAADDYGAPAARLELLQCDGVPLKAQEDNTEDEDGVLQGALGSEEGDSDSDVADLQAALDIFDHDARLADEYGAAALRINEEAAQV